MFHISVNRITVWVEPVHLQADSDPGFPLEEAIHMRPQNPAVSPQPWTI